MRRGKIMAATASAIAFAVVFFGSAYLIASATTSNRIAITRYRSPLHIRTISSSNSRSNSIILNFLNESPNDELFCSVAYGGASQVTSVKAPSGFALIGSIPSSSSTTGMRLFSHRLGTNEDSGRYAFALVGPSAALGLAASCEEWTQVDPTTPYTVANITAFYGSARAYSALFHAPVIGTSAAAFFGDDEYLTPSYIGYGWLQSRWTVNGSPSPIFLSSQFMPIASSSYGANIVASMGWSASSSHTPLSAVVLINPIGAVVTPPTPVVTPTVAQTPSPSPSHSPTASPTPTAAPTATPTPTVTPTVIPTNGTAGINASDFADRVGMNIHLSDGAYGDPNMLLAHLNYLNIKHVRDGMNVIPSAYYVRATLNTLGANGIKADLITDPTMSVATIAADVASVNSNVTEAIEAPNEYDNSGDSAWYTKDAAEMQNIWTYVSGSNPSVLAIGPSLGSIFTNYSQLGDLSASQTHGNMHDYLDGFPAENTGYGGVESHCPSQVYGSVAYNICESHLASVSKPIISTEFGYQVDATSVNKVDAGAQGTYLIRQVLQHIIQGVPRSYIYSLYDSGGETFGLLSDATTPRVADDEFAGFMNLLKDSTVLTGPCYVPASITTPGVSTFGVCLSGGRYVLIAWQPVTGWDTNAKHYNTVNPITATLTFSPGFTLSSTVQWSYPLNGAYTPSTIGTTASIMDRPSIIMLNGPSSPPALPVNPAYRPYAANSVWNGLDATAATVSSSSSTWMAYYARSTSFFNHLQFGYKNQANQYQHPIYFGQATDPLYTLSCTDSYGDCSGSWHMPTYAIPAGGTDGHMSVIDTASNVELDCYGVTFISGGVLHAGNCDHSNVATGDGLYGEQTRSGARLWAGVARAQEIAQGAINHGLFVTAPCTSNGSVYPSMTVTTSDTTCLSNQGAPYGSWLRLNMTPTAIDALSIPASHKTILKALAARGGFLADTNGNNGFQVQTEADPMYSAAGYSNANCPTTSPSTGIPCTPLTAWEHVQGDPDWDGSQYTIDISADVNWATYAQFLNAPPN